MYLEHYQLKLKPFQITADPKFLWLGEKHKEALATLRYGIVDNRGFLLLTGEVGTGKTILINRLVSLLKIDTVVATLTDPDLESMDFYNLLADGLKMERTFESKGAFLIHLRDFLHQSYSKQQQVLLIIDESQRLNHRLMEDIRVLSNIELHDRKLINIFFVGQQEFNSILMTPQNRALAQRITVRYHIEPLDEEETKSYVEHRLKVAGSTRQIFNSSALKEVYQFSGGIPRLINIISDHALLTGYARGVKQLDDAIVKECAADLSIPVKRPSLDGHGGQQEQKIINTVSMEDRKAGSTSQENGTRGDSPDAKDGSDQDKQKENGQADRKSGPWRFAYAALVILLIGLVAFAITHFTTGRQPRWDSEELTPSKYKDTLDKEQALISNQLNSVSKSPDDAVQEIPKPVEKEGMETEPQKQKETASIKADKTPDAQIEKGDQSVRPEKTAMNQSAGDTDTRTAKNQKSEASSNQDVGEIEPLPLIKENMTIQFDINSNEIDPLSFPMLNRVANYLVNHPDETITVRGYTDSTGSQGYNESVSLFRANNVKSYLIGKGVASERIKILAMGAQSPIASNETFEGRRKNRRVEIDFDHDVGGGN